VTLWRMEWPSPFANASRISGRPSVVFHGSRIGLRVRQNLAMEAILQGPPLAAIFRTNEGKRSPPDERRKR